MPRFKSGAFSKFQQVSKTDEPTTASGSSAEVAKPDAEVEKLRPLIRRSIATPLKELSVEECKDLLEALRTSVASDAFQKALDNLRSRDWGAFKKRGAVAKLLSMAWKGPVKAAGLGIHAQSFPSMLTSVRNHAEQPGIRTIATEVERLLRFFPGALFGSNAGAMKGAQESLNARGRRAFSQMMGPDAAQVEVKIPANASGASSVIVEEPAVKLVRDRAMNLGECKEMLKALKEVCNKRSFQEGLQTCLRKHPQQAQATAARFIGQSWASTMSIFDFPISPEAFKEFAAGIAKHGYNLHVKMMAHEVESMIGVPKGSFFGVASDEKEEDNEDENEEEDKKDTTPPPGAVGNKIVQVSLRHAVEGTFLQVTVPSTATFQAVKEAVSSLTGREDILVKGKLVRQNHHGMYSSYKDQDPIGTTRDILVLGADLRRESGSPQGGEVGLAPAKGKVKLHLAPEDLGRKYNEAGQVISEQSQKKQQPKAAEAQWPSLTKQEAMELQKALYRGFSAPLFQKKLQEVEEQFTGDEFVQQRNKLFLTVQATVIPKYGFEGTERGVMTMLTAFAPWNADPQIQHMSMEINRLLRMDKGRGAKPKANPAPQPATGNPQEPAPAPVEHPKPAQPATKPGKIIEKPIKLIPELEAALIHSAKMVYACPDMRPDDFANCNIWIVVGGEHSGGLLVRFGAELDSAKIPSKLLYGCIVEELEIDGNRLHYKRLKGDGPDIGWVNLKSQASKNPDGALLMLLGDSEMAKKKEHIALEEEYKRTGQSHKKQSEQQEEQREAEEKKRAEEEKRQAEKLIKNQTEWQEEQRKAEVEEARARTPKIPAANNTSAQATQPSVQLTTLNREGELPSSVHPLKNLGKLQKAACQAEAASEFRLSAAATRTDCRAPVPVLVRHATRHEEVNLTVPAGSTIADVKEILLCGAQHVEPSKVRLAKRYLNTFTYLEEDTPLGELRDLVVMGMSFQGYQHAAVEPLTLPSLEEFETQVDREEPEAELQRSQEEEEEEEPVSSVESRRKAIEHLASLSQQDRRGALNQVTAAAKSGAKVVWGGVSSIRTTGPVAG